MSPLEFAAALDAMRLRVDHALTSEATRRGLPHLPPSYEELQEVVEELGVAQEELRQQNEELEQTRALADLERQRYEDLFHHAPDGYLVTDTDALITDANAAACRLLGGSARALSNKPLVLFVAPSDRPVFYAELARLLRSEEPQEWFFTLQPRIGSGLAPIPVSVRVTRSSGGLLWLLRDVTERFRQAEATRRTVADLERRLRQTDSSLAGSDAGRTLLEINPQPLFVVSPRTRSIRLANDAAGRLHGRPAAALSGYPLEALCHADDLSVFLADLAPALLGRATGARWRHLRHDGTSVLVNSVVRPFNWDGESAILLELHECPVIRSAEDTADELASLLTASMWFAESIRMGTSVTETGQASADLLLAALDRMGGILRHLFDADRPPVSRPTQTRNVLVVDDDPCIRMVVKAILEQDGCVVREACDGQEAMRELARGGPVDLVITDLDMPHLTGAELIAKLRPGLPVLIVSASAAVPIELQGMPFLAKPFKRAEFCDVVKRLLKQ